MKRQLQLITALLLTALCATFIITLSISGPSWSPGLPTTNDTITCSWANSSDTIAQNITILKDGTVFNWTYENASDGPLSASKSISAASTTKSEVWTCRITLDNGTATLTQEANVTIQNAAPETPTIYNQTNEDIGTRYIVFEDTIYTFDVNSSDKDGDTLTYYFKAATTGFCAMADTAVGTASCSPTQSNIVNNSPTLLNITFWVDDDDATFAKSSSRTVTFNVTPVNDAPVPALTNKSTPVNTTLNYTFSITDEESSFPITTLMSAPAEIADKVNITTRNSNGTSVSFIYNATNPDFNDIGLWTITINVTDNSSTLGTNDSRSARYNFTLNITPVGRRPYFKAVSANITPVGGIYSLVQGESIRINITANDYDANSTLTFLDDTSKFEIATVKADTNTSDAIGELNFTATNADVGRFNVTITIRDQETLTNTTIIQFEVVNVNDPPVIDERSFGGANTQGNTNASNLTAYANTPFVFDMNTTDPDLPYGDVLAFSDNTSLFAINASTGRISFTPTDGQIGGPYAINISVADSGGMNASRTILLTIRSNSPPQFNPALPHLRCTTKAECSLDLDTYASDPEEPDDQVMLYTIRFIGANLTSLNYSNTSGLINFTTLKSDVGNYTLNVTVEDSFGARNSSIMNLSVNNTPEAPTLTRYDLTNQTIVEQHLLAYELQASDDDFLAPGAAEQVNFTTNLSLPHTITPLPASGSTAKALISFTPALGAAGNYSILINATDRFNLSSTRVVSIEVLPKVPPPNVTNITPWGVDNSSHAIQTTWASTGQPQFADGIADVYLDENTTVLFNVTVNDTMPLNFTWKLNGTVVKTEQGATGGYTKQFDFFSAGGHNVTLNVSNSRLEYRTFTWLLRVQNVNRLPVLNAPLDSPIIVNGTEIRNDYFTGASGQRYYDPDDDLNSDSQILSPENSTLTFSTGSSCPYAVMTISGNDLTFVGKALGTCQVIFAAQDRQGASVSSNTVTVNVTEIFNGTQIEQPTSSSGGGGGGGANFIPITRKLETPRAFNLIAPKLVTIYDNSTLRIPITINNTWNGSLRMVRLDTEVNETSVNTSLDIDLFEEIPEGESREVILSVEHYRMGGNYEVRVTSNVSDPRYSDEALILLNSIEQSQEGEDFNVKVTFANDLVNEHPECQELNEVLKQAQERVAQGDIAEGTKLVDSVINGCKYLVSMQQNIEEKPGRINPIINIDDLSVKAIMLGVLAFVVLSSIAFLVYYHYSHRPEDDI